MNPPKAKLRWSAPAIAVTLLALWELAARQEWIAVLFFPAPSVVLEKLSALIASGELFQHIGITVARMLLAAVVGGGAGLILGLALGWSERLRAVIDPFIAAIHPVPKLSFLPLIMLIFGIGFFSKALVVSISTFFPMVINTMGGVRTIDTNYFDVAKLHGARTSRVFWRIVLPGSLPMIMIGARLALIRALGATIALELITAQSGLGSMLFFAWQTLRTEELYATIFVIAVFGYVFRQVVDRATSAAIPWQRGADRG